MMESMGMKVESLDGPVSVEIKTPTREITIDDAQVTITKMQDQTIYQVMGGEIVEKVAGREAPSISAEDIQLVAEQANVTIEVAKKALEETSGNLAQAILLLAQRRA